MLSLRLLSFVFSGCDLLYSAEALFVHSLHQLYLNPFPFFAVNSLLFLMLLQCLQYFFPSSARLYLNLRHSLSAVILHLCSSTCSLVGHKHPFLLNSMTIYRSGSSAVSLYSSGLNGSALFFIPRHSPLSVNFINGRRAAQSPPPMPEPTPPCRVLGLP